MGLSFKQKRLDLKWFSAFVLVALELFVTFGVGKLNLNDDGMATSPKNALVWEMIESFVTLVVVLVEKL
jgi:hypothetical protein